MLKAGFFILSTLQNLRLCYYNSMEEKIKWWQWPISIITIIIVLYWGLKIIGWTFDILTSPPIYEAGECPSCDDFDSNYPH